MKKSSMVLLVLIVSLGLFAQGQVDIGSKYSVQDLPDTDVFTIDPMNPMACFMEGLYSYDIKMDDGSIRTIKHYYPADLGYRMPVVILAQPEDVDAIDFLMDSGWISMADQNDFMLVLMEPGKRGWMDNELEYTGKVYDFIQARTYYTNDDSAYYLVGYGEGADIVLAEATIHADQYSGVAALGAQGDVEYAMELAAATESFEEGRMQNTIPLPVWIGAASKTWDIIDVIRYWRQSNNCGDNPVSNAYASEIFSPVPWLQASRGLTDDDLSKVVLTLGRDDYYDEEFTNYLWSEFLMRARRQDSYKIGALRYYATPEELGMAHESGIVDGTMREWYVYVPSAVKSGKVANVPVVFAFHGGGGWGYEFTARSGWYKLAEDKNFILVMGCGSRSNTAFKASTTWKASDIAYFEYMRNRMLDEYPVDSTRIYVTGQSMGNMFSNQIAYMRPDLISAATATSGLRLADMSAFDSAYKDVVAPMLLSIGKWDSNHLPGPKTETDKDVWFKAWTARVGVEYAGLDDLSSYASGTFDHLVAMDDNGVPLVRMMTANTKIHAMIPEEYEVLFDYMSQFTRTENGELHYLGHPVK